MDNQLKVRFKLNGLEFEMEGNENVVADQFEKFKGFVSTQMTVLGKQGAKDITDIDSLPAAQSDIPLPPSSQLPKGSQLPALKEVVIKDLPKSEADWVLVYARYITFTGSVTFTEIQVKVKYEDSGRKTDQRFKNLRNSINSLVSRGLIKVHNDTEYFVTELGIDRVTQILSGIEKSTKSIGNESSKSANASGKKTTVPKVSATLKILPDLSFKPTGAQSLIDFMGSLPFVSNPEKILGIVHYCKSILRIEAVTPEHIFTGFREIKTPVVKNFHQSITDTKNKKGWLDFTDASDIKCSVQGEEYILYELPEKKKNKQNGKS